VGVVLPVLLIGPTAALFETSVSLSLPPESHFRYGSVILVNLLTLGLVRPVLALLGIARDAVYPALTRATFASGTAVLSTLIIPPLGDGPAALDQVTVYGVGLCVGLLTVALLEALPPARLKLGDLARAPADAGAPGASMRISPREDRPQWQVLLLALRGTCLERGAASAGEPHLTQKALAERTGMRASRISTLVRELNASAASRLDASLPGWREGRPAGLEPELVAQHRGSVPGMPGVWVYYRLTPLGERLATALLDRQKVEELNGPGQKSPGTPRA